MNVKTTRPDERVIVRPATNSQLRSSEITFPDGHQAFEIAGENHSYSAMVIDYSEISQRNQLFYPSDVLCLPIGTKIHSISVYFRADEKVTSRGNMQISLGEIADNEIPETSDFVEDQITEYYNESDLVDQLQTQEYITYSFNTPYEYKGSCLIIDLYATTQEVSTDIHISTPFNEFESIYNIRSVGEHSQFSDTWKPNIALEVEFPNNDPIPYIPFSGREQILGYASVGSSSTTSYVTLENKGGSAFTVSGLEGSSHFRLSNNNITVPAGSSEQVGFVFTPQSEGTWEENVSLVTSAGNLDLTLTGTTYRQAPYEREVESSDNVEEQIWQEMETITELSVSGTVGYSDRYSFTRMPNLVNLDMSTSITDITNWRRDLTELSQIEQLALPQGLLEFDFEGMDNLHKLILPIGYEYITELPQQLTYLVSFSLNPPEVYNSEYVLQYIETVYVPANAVENWKNHPNWRQKKIAPITDEVLGGSFRQVTIRNDMVYTPESYPIGEIQVNIRPDMELETATAGLTNQAPLNMTKLSLSYRLQNRADYSGDYDGLYLEQGAYSSFINENEETTLQSARYTLQVEPQTWHYVAFPFDVPVSALQAQDPSVEYVIRYYDGKRRGEHGTDINNNWEDVDPNGTLQAGQGYIIQTNYVSSYPNLFTFTWESEGEAIQPLLHTEEIEIPLSDYPSEYTYNANWNFVGNPYPSFFNIQAIDYNAPIIIWNGEGYTALSMTDDTYALRPLEAFFTQKPKETSSMVFRPEGRQTNADVTGSSFRAMPNPERKLVNLRLVGESYTDRSRIVINPKAELSYELTCDAGKWMSPNPKVPQLYSLGEEGQRYAINERPAGSGQIPLGLYIGETGTYTLKIVSDETTPEVHLMDKYKNEQVVLNREEYTFYAEAGTIDDRFEVRLSESVTGNELSQADASVRLYTQEGSLYLQVAAPSDVRIYTALGVLVTERRLKAGTTKIDLPSGLYLVNLNQTTTHKVFIH